MMKLAIIFCLFSSFCQPKMKHLCWDASLSGGGHPAADYYTVQIDNGDLIVTNSTCIPIDMKPGNHKAQIRAHSFLHGISSPSEIKWVN